MTQTWTADDLASWLAHDLRTPLGVVIGFAEALLDDDEMDADTQREFLGIIYGESQRLARLVEQAVRLMRLERESSTWQISPVSVERWLQDGQQRAATELEAMEVTVETLPLRQAQGGLLRQACPERGRMAQGGLLGPGKGKREEKTLVVRGTPKALGDALAGLLVGVGEFAGPGATLRLETVCDESTVTLALCTDAFCLEEGQAAIAFQPFQRLGNAPYHDPTAAGLELALCATIVARHGGRVWTRPEGKGVCFGITQPLAGAEVELAPGEPVDSVPAQSPPMGGRSPRWGG